MMWNVPTWLHVVLLQAVLILGFLLLSPFLIRGLWDSSDASLYWYSFATSVSVDLHPENCETGAFVTYAPFCSFRHHLASLSKCLDYSSWDAQCNAQAGFGDIHPKLFQKVWFLVEQLSQLLPLVLAVGTDEKPLKILFERVYQTGLFFNYSHLKLYMLPFRRH